MLQRPDDRLRSFGGMVRKPLQAVLDNIAEDITLEVSMSTFMSIHNGCVD